MADVEIRINRTPPKRKWKPEVSRAIFDRSFRKLRQQREAKVNRFRRFQSLTPRNGLSEEMVQKIYNEIVSDENIHQVAAEELGKFSLTPEENLDLYAELVNVLRDELIEEYKREALRENNIENQMVEALSSLQDSEKQGCQFRCPACLSNQIALSQTEFGCLNCLLTLKSYQGMKISFEQLLEKICISMNLHRVSGCTCKINVSNVDQENGEMVLHIFGDHCEFYECLNLSY